MAVFCGHLRRHPTDVSDWTRVDKGTSDGEHQEKQQLLANRRPSGWVADVAALLFADGEIKNWSLPHLGTQTNTTVEHPSRRQHHMCLPIAHKATKLPLTDNRRRTRHPPSGFLVCATTVRPHHQGLPLVQELFRSQSSETVLTNSVDKSSDPTFMCPVS